VQACVGNAQNSSNVGAPCSGRPYTLREQAVIKICAWTAYPEARGWIDGLKSMMALLRTDLTTRDEHVCVIMRAKLMAEGRTPLLAAASRCWGLLCLDMLDRGADTSAKDNVSAPMSMICT
jgi:hypothetical protein